MSGLLGVAARVLPPGLFARLQALGKVGYLPDLRNPRTFNERLLVKRLRDRDELIVQTADKFTLREYVRTSIGGEYLPELYDVVEDARKVDVDRLPPAYVMKGTHGSKWNRIVTQGELTNPEAQRLAADWLSRCYYWERQEWAYLELKPKVIFEENLAPGSPIDDFKVFTFAGVARMVQLDRDRFTRHSRALFTPAWQRLNVRFLYRWPDSPLPAPQRLDEMLALAEVLGRPFEFARVDLYAVGNRIVVGEITHYPESGVARFVPRSFDLELGEVWGSARPISDTFLAT